LLGEARVSFFSEHQTSPAVHLIFYSVDVVDPSPVLKQLMHEADHSPLLSAEVTDQCSCNCASPLCLHGLHRDNLTFYHCFGGMTSISTCILFCPTDNEGGVQSWNSVSLYSSVFCKNTHCCYLMICIKHGILAASVHVSFPSV